MVSLIYIGIVPGYSSNTTGTVTKLANLTVYYSFTSDMTALMDTVIDRLAVSLNRGLDSVTNAQNFVVRNTTEIDGSSACSSDTDTETPTSLGTGVGCHRVEFSIEPSSNLTEYEVRYYTQFWVNYFSVRASAVDGAFSVSILPDGPSDPEFSWLVVSNGSSVPSGWVQRLYPQEDWIAQSVSCVSGISCETLTIAPSMRYLHSSILYQSWNFERDVLPHASLCMLPSMLGNNSACTTSCTTNATCMGITSMDDYYTQMIDSDFWTGPYFSTDDGFDFAVTDSHSSACPIACCGTRRNCMRTCDDLGRLVPFDASYMLIFGGRTRQKFEVDGLDLYLNCEAILANLNITDNQSLSSCYEFQSDELWRFDVAEDTWELLKPRTLEVSSGANTISLTYPSGRYAHASALVQIPAEDDLSNTRRQYMYMFGGLSIDCTNGLCYDLWRYEIPWAAQAYWPTTGAGNPSNWLRGNVWKKLRDCPYGGRHRHSMEANERGLYVFGGQKKGGWDDRLLVYHLESDSWNIVASLGYRFFTRSGVDYLGNFVATNLTDFSKFVDDEDVLGDVGIEGSSGIHPPQFPIGRGDHCSLTLANSTTMYIANGFESFESPYYLENDIWGYLFDENVWTRIFGSNEETPSSRRGAGCAMVDDEAAMYMFGGNNGDDLFSDLWTFGIAESIRSNRVWTQITQDAGFPPAVTYHSFDYDVNSDKFLLFGGLNWTVSNLTLSDELADVDRTCFSSARAILKTVCTDATNSTCALEKAKSQIDTNCDASNSTSFCCDASNRTSATTLQTLSDLCTIECQLESFTSVLTIGFGEGIWIYSKYAGCEAGNCSSVGSCLYAQCICMPGFNGPDCTQETCPGSFCYFDTDAMNSTCHDCSGNGSCSEMECTCDPGWTGPDCSTVDCSCGDFGTCLQDFPIHQCVCDPSYSGYSCEVKLCLNDCSESGTCLPSGECECFTNFFGADCSVYVQTASVDTHMSIGFAIFALAMSLLCNI